MTHIEALKHVLQCIKEMRYFIAETYLEKLIEATEEDNYQGSDAAKAAHMMDLYTALGVKWGEDPFAVIAKMREAATEESSATQEPYGYLFHGIANHTKHKTLFEKVLPESFERRWWSEGLAVYTHPQPKAEQEPVAWELGAEVYWNDSPALSDYIRKEGTPLYTHPQPKAEQEPKREPLTDEQKPVAWVDLTDSDFADCQKEAQLAIDAQRMYDVNFTKAVIAKFKAKNSQPKAEQCIEITNIPSWTKKITVNIEKHEWVGLTDEELEDVWPFVFNSHELGNKTIYQAIEAKLKEKNT